AVLAEKTHNFALGYLEGNVLDRDMTCVSLGQAFDFDHISMFDGRRYQTVTCWAPVLSESIIPGIGLQGIRSIRTTARDVRRWFDRAPFRRQLPPPAQAR